MRVGRNGVACCPSYGLSCPNCHNVKQAEIAPTFTDKELQWFRGGVAEVDILYADYCACGEEGYTTCICGNGRTSTQEYLMSCIPF